MPERMCKNLIDMPKSKVAAWLSNFETILFDCDDVLWKEDCALPNATATLNALQDTGKIIYLVTNNGTKSCHQIWLRAINLGFNIEQSQIIAPTDSIVSYLKQQLNITNTSTTQKVYVVGSEALANELEAAGFTTFGTGPEPFYGMSDYLRNDLSQQRPADVCAVVVGFDEHFNYAKLLKAAHFLSQNEACLFLATNADVVHRYPQYTIPGTGAILKGIECCAKRQALLLGKPNPLVCEPLIRAGIVRPQKTLMVGDCCKVDVQFGKNCGFQTLLVGTGAYKLKDVENFMKDYEANKKFIPDAYLPTMGDLFAFI